jgi:hypothetical protein
MSMTDPDATATCEILTFCSATGIRAATIDAGPRAEFEMNVCNGMSAGSSTRLNATLSTAVNRGYVLVLTMTDS